MLRKFVWAALGAAVLAASSPAPASADDRKSINALTATELEGLRRGVAVMKSRDTAARNSSDWRRSWLFWANVHGHFGEDCDGPVTGDGMSGVIAWEATNTAEDSTWCTCLHKTDAFLPWHRIALYYFERVLQQAAGMSTLRLPYWDYATDPALPEAFRNPTYVNAQGQTVANPLYVANRSAALNAGSAGISTAARSATNAMAATGYSTFRTRIEKTPHGAVHCAVSVTGCPSGYMGRLSTAALDPIFWLHHSNTDRLYDCWTRSGTNRLPSGSLLNQRYSFPNETGQVVSMKVRDGLTPTLLGYTYAGGSSCAGVIAATSGPGLALAQAGPAGQADGGPGAVSSEPARTAEAGAKLRPVQNRLRANLPGAAQSRRGRPTLRLEDVAPNELDPGMYDVYMVAPDGRRALIGTMSFFADQTPEPAAPADHAGHDPAWAGTDFDFDLSGPARELGLHPGAGFELAFFASSGLEPLAPAALARGLAVPDERRSPPPRIGRVRVEVQ